LSCEDKLKLRLSSVEAGEAEGQLAINRSLDAISQKGVNRNGKYS